jgi:hypothetical protein
VLPYLQSDQEPHDANQLDINAKYRDVLPVSEVISYLKRLR